MGMSRDENILVYGIHQKYVNRNCAGVEAVTKRASF